MELNLDIYVDYKDKRYKAEGYYGSSVGDLVLIFMDMELEGATVQEVARIEGSEIHLRTPNGNEPSYRYMGQYLILKPYGSADPRGDIRVYKDVQYVRVDAQAMLGDLIEILEPNKMKPRMGPRRDWKARIKRVDYVHPDDLGVELGDGHTYSGAYKVLIPRKGVLPTKTHRYTTHKHVFMDDVFKEGQPYLITESGDTCAAIFVGFSQDYKTASFKNPAYDTLDLDVDVEDLLTGKRDITPLVPKKGV